MIEVELSCFECGAVIVLIDPSLDLVEYPLCWTCRNREHEGCEDLTEQTAPKTGPRRI